MKKLFVVFVFLMISMIGYSQSTKEINDLYHKSLDYYYEQEYDSARVGFENLVEIDSINSNYNYFLGLCHFFEADYNFAIYFLEKSTEDVRLTNNIKNQIYSPHSIYFYIAFSYEKMKKYDKAIENYKIYKDYEIDGMVITNTEKRIKQIEENYDK